MPEFTLLRAVCKCSITVRECAACKKWNDKHIVKRSSPMSLDKVNDGIARAEEIMASLSKVDMMTQSDKIKLKGQKWRVVMLKKRREVLLSQSQVKDKVI